MDPRRDSSASNQMPEQKEVELNSFEQADIALNQNTPLAAVPVPARPTVFTPEVIVPTTSGTPQNTKFSEPDFNFVSASHAEMTAPPTVASSVPMSGPEAPAILQPTTQMAAPPTDVVAKSNSAEPAPTTSPVAQPGPALFANDVTPLTSGSPQAKKNKKLFLLIGGSIGLLLLVVAAGVFGFYLPNRPNAVWNTGINRTGDALTTVVASATDKKALETLSTSKISGEVNASFQDVTYKGALTSKYKGNDSDSGLTLTMKSSEQDMNIVFKALTETVKDSSYPNAYFQFTGLKELGVLDLVAPGLSNYEGKWISVPSATYQKWMEKYSGEDADKANFSSADIAEITQTSIRVTDDYVFTTDPAKAVLKQNSFVGKETVDDIKTYHYKVSINKEHAKDYCVALVTEVTKTKAYKNITGYTDEIIKKSRDNGSKSCKSDVAKDIKGSDEYDMWIDGKYKLIYKVRVSDKDTKGDYQEFGQRYTGGDVLTFFYKLHSEENKADVATSFAYNTKTLVTTMNMDGESKSKDSPFTFDAKVTFEPSKDEVKVAVPKDAVPIETILQQLSEATKGTTKERALPTRG